MPRAAASSWKRHFFLFFCRDRLRPRVLVDVSKVDTSTRLLGQSGAQKASFPLYVTATALAKLAHPDGGYTRRVAALPATGFTFACWPV